MFEVEDYVVYGQTGVCQVTNIGPLDIGRNTKDKLYYTLSPVYVKGNKIYTLVDSDKVMLRKLITKEEAWALIDDLSSVEVIWEENGKLREGKYREIMKKYTCSEWLKIIRTLTVRKQETLSQGKKFSAIDERYFRQAEDCLYREFAIALSMPVEEVANFIAERVECLALA